VVILEFDENNNNRPERFFVSTHSEYVPVTSCHRLRWMLDLSFAITKLGINYLYAADERTFRMMVKMRIPGVRVIQRVFNLAFNCTSCKQDNCIKKRAMLLLKKNVMPTVECCEIISESPK
jgi:hypothetical protein